MHIHSLRRAALAACAFAMLAASSASAATTELRVEAEGLDIGPGWRYVHDSVSYTTSENEACAGSGDTGTIDGPSALGLLVQAADFTRALAPVQISDQFEFGLFVCGVGSYTSSESAFWLYKVDHVAPEVGADKFAIDGSHDGVLWYFVNTATGVNTGNELVLRPADNVVEAGAPTSVVVDEYDASGTSTPAADVQILGAGDVTTDTNGTASLVFENAGRPVIRGVRGSDIPTDGIRLCVWEDSESECDNYVSGWIVGTDGDDTIAGGDERERILGRTGDDKITSRGDDAPDKVRCGPGRDVARADRLDRVARSCETVRR